MKELHLTFNATRMENEDFASLIAYRYDPQIASMTTQVDSLAKAKDSLERQVEDIKHEVSQKFKLEQHLAEMENEQKLLKTELHIMKKQNEKLQTQIEAMEAAQTGNVPKIYTELQNKQTPDVPEKSINKNATHESLRVPSQ